jgi:hypothetical protein
MERIKGVYLMSIKEEFDPTGPPGTLPILTMVVPFDEATAEKFQGYVAEMAAQGFVLQSSIKAVDAYLLVFTPIIGSVSGPSADKDILFDSGQLPS